jgi:hypothetical protein
MPVRSGERITLRLLPDGPAGVELGALGLPTATVCALERAIGASDGLLIVCGPTGSGKTTTLHALLARLAVGPRNVVTLEDPVERIVFGTSQTQVAPAQGLTFAAGRRHLLRHDPDVLLVGEVRDRETAQLAVEAAHTGHLVLTSLHAVDAPAALTRLHELGVTSTLLADTVRIVVAQRLLTLPCPDCAVPTDVTADVTADVTGDALCAACGGTGTRGRSAVAETLELDRLPAPITPRSPQRSHHASGPPRSSVRPQGWRGPTTRCMRRPRPRTTVMRSWSRRYPRPLERPESGEPHMPTGPTRTGSDACPPGSRSTRPSRRSTIRRSGSRSPRSAWSTTSRSKAHASG